MDAALQELVWERAVRRCEYCRMLQDHDDTLFQIDHIIAVCHGGPTRPGNLALACFLCNSFKGPNLSGVDPTTRRIVPLYNPRRHKWARHFRWNGGELIGSTPQGRAT